MFQLPRIAKPSGTYRDEFADEEAPFCFNFPG